MNKTVLLAGVASALFAVNANAIEFTPYVSGKITYSDITYDGTDSWTHGSNPGSAKTDLDDKVWGASIAAGTSVKVFGGSIRTELEYNWNDTAEKSMYVKDLRANGTAELESQSLFLNAYYDIDTGTKFTPYVGGGIGYAKIEGSMSMPGMNISEDNTNFAWQLGAGVAYAVNKNISVDFGYRYTDMGDLTANIYPTEKFKIDVDSHELLLGVRYTF